jgi:ribonuclease P protein component
VIRDKYLFKYNLDKSHIIRNRTEFSNTVRNGKTYKGKYFIIAAVRSDLLKCGFTTRSGLRKVDRNRLRRLARELWRTSQGRYGLRGNLVIITRESAQAASYPLLEEDFNHLLRQIERAQQAERQAD